MRRYERVFEEDIDISIKAYTSIGGQGASKFPFTISHKNTLIKAISKNKKIIAYRGYAVSEKEWERKFESGYTEIGNINIEPGLKSFSLDKNRRGSYSSGEQSVFLKIELNKYLPILEKSIYPEEQEILTYDLKWKVTKDWEYKHGIAYIEGKQI
jgi:hypothetical protein